MTIERKNRVTVDIEDVEYVEIDGSALLARLYVPRGNGPFPVMVHIHGGAWIYNDRTLDDEMLKVLASFGVSIVSIDFRVPPVAGYPASMADANYAIRWAKINAERLRSSPDRVGVMGGSSGGHSAVLVGLRPHDTRYSSIKAPEGYRDVDAAVRCVVALWPVIDPLGRYEYAVGLREVGTDKLRDMGLKSNFPFHIPLSQDLYWKSKEAMREGGPAAILESEERVAMPPMFCLGSSADNAHPNAHLERFVELYREAGGRVEFEVTDKPPLPLLCNEPEGPEAQRILSKIVGFLVNL